MSDPQGIDAGPVEAQPGEEPGTEALTAARESRGERAGRLARSTALFSLATSLSRVAGLVREVVAAYYFGLSGAMSAFTIAFQVPNLVRSLFADAAIQAAFVPVFTEHLEHGRKREAFRLATTLIYLVTLVLTVLTAFFVLIAPLLMPVFVGTKVPEGLTVTLAQILFPILVMLGTTGMVVGILNSYDRFGAFAISPFFWNVAIIFVLIALRPVFPADKQIYAYAIGVLVGTAIQLAIPAWDLRNTPFRLLRAFDWKSLEVRRVLILMLPVTLSLGLINFNLLINSAFGALVSVRRSGGNRQGVSHLHAAAGDLLRRRDHGDVPDARAGSPPVASTTTCARRWPTACARSSLLLIPAAAAMLVLATPMIRLVYQHGVFNQSDTDLASTALFWFAFSLPLNGLFLILTRTFFSLQRPWVPTWISGINLAITAIGALVLYGPYGVGGIVAATVIATGVSVLIQVWVLRGQLGRLELGRFVWTAVRVSAAAAALAAASYGVWFVLDDALGRGLVAQVISLSAGLAAGGLIYAAAITALRIPEAQQIWRLLRRGRGGLGAGLAVGPQAVVLADRREAEVDRLRAELRQRQLVLGAVDRLAGVDEPLQHAALVVLEALLVDLEVEVGQQLLHLAEVVLEADRHATGVDGIRHPGVEAQLVGGAEREAGVVRVALDVVGLDGVEALARAGVEALSHDRLQHAERPDVEPPFLREAREVVAEDPLRELAGVGAVRLPGADVDVADRPVVLSVDPRHVPAADVHVDVVDGRRHREVDLPLELPLPGVRRGDRVPAAMAGGGVGQAGSARCREQQGSEGDEGRGRARFHRNQAIGGLTEPPKDRASA